MAGLTSPDVPAVYCYLIVLVVGLVVARAYVNERLKDYPDRWAFLSAWLLFVAYCLVPPVLFWLLDYTGALLDTSIFAALLVALGYRQLFAGSVQGVTVPTQATALWKPFQTWVDRVAERINDRQGRYLDRFAEYLRGDMLRNPEKLGQLQTLALQRTRKLEELGKAIGEISAFPEASVAQSRLFDRLWPDLKTSAPNQYGYLLYRHGLVSLGRRWWWLERGRAKTVTGASLLGVVLLAVVAWSWAAHDLRGATVRQRLEQRYYQWRFLKPNATERDRWRAREYFARELRAAASRPLPLPAEARAEAQRALDATPRDDNTVRAALEVERRAVHTDALVRPLLRELRYPEISSRQLDDVLGLVVSFHTRHLDFYYLPELIESLRTSNEVVRLNVHKTLYALQKADFPRPALDARLAAWEPRKSDGPEQIDGFVRLWNEWLQATIARRS